jgi:hypothetical protein
MFESAPFPARGRGKETSYTVARQNAFARRLLDEQRTRHSSNHKKVVVVRDAQPTVDEQLVHLEDDIRKLKIEFDIFFNGASKRPPYDTKSRVESLVKRLGDERKLTYAQRYRYNTLVARYVVLRDLWRRNVQDREEGRDPVAAARAQLGKPRAAEKERHASFVCADAREDDATVRSLYEALVEAKKTCGETVEDFPLAKFQEMIASKTEALKERLGCERVRYSVYTEGGRVSFKAKADK